MTITIAGLSIVLSEVDNIFRTFVPFPDWLAQGFRDIGSGYWDSILALVIVAPLTEEFLFRGLFLQGFLSHYTVPKAMIASALLFGIGHLNPWQGLPAIFGGILFAWWFVQTRSLVPCLFGHALWNGLPILIALVFQLEIPGYTSVEFDKVQHQPLWFDLLGLVLLSVGVWLFAKISRQMGTVTEPSPATSQAATDHGAPGDLDGR
jgi:membrane protease YdiL (CAAX protease family)